MERFFKFFIIACLSFFAVSCSNEDDEPINETYNRYDCERVYISDHVTGNITELEGRYSTEIIIFNGKQVKIVVRDECDKIKFQQLLIEHNYKNNSCHFYGKNHSGVTITAYLFQVTGGKYHINITEFKE